MRRGNTAALRFWTECANINGMKNAAVLTITVAIGHAQKSAAQNDQALKQDMQRLAAHEVDLVLRSDVVGMERFYPDDMIITNPFNQVIDKSKVIERVQANIIKYTSMTKTVEHVRRFGDIVVTMGLETAKVTPDANRTDAGKMTYRRFSEVWTLRGGAWKKIVRHANHVEPAPQPIGSADDPLVGVWKRNNALSKYIAEAPPKEMNIVITPARDSRYLFRVNGVLGDGREVNVSYTAALDGQPVPITGNPRYTTVAITKIDHNTYEVVFHKDGRALRKDTSVLTNGGRIRTITAKDADGKVVAISVDEKQPR
jgi:hypothetical protein